LNAPTFGTVVSLPFSVANFYVKPAPVAISSSAFSLSPSYFGIAAILHFLVSLL
jgi:hypothetical protein